MKIWDLLKKLLNSNESQYVNNRNNDSKIVTNIVHDLTTENNKNQIETKGKALIDSITSNKITKSYIDNVSLKNISLDMYQSIDIDDDFNMKLIEFNKITKKYENIKSSSVDIDFNKFKLKYDNILNKAQLIAATTINGPLLIIAGAGSGKTTTVVYRVSYLIENNINPESIVLLTFTRKAANEMKDRVSNLMGLQSTSNIFAGTFHSFSNYILRKYSTILGIPQNFTIIDSEDAADIISFIKSEIDLEKKEKTFPAKNRLANIFSMSRNMEIPIPELIIKKHKDIIDFTKEIEELFKVFMQYKKVKNLFDYDDLMDELLDGLEKNSLFKKIINEKYSYIMVDEYQDTNNVQRRIVNLLAGSKNNIMVVGDDSQSIYAFRGANFENIIRFPESFPNCKVIKLEENYRSNQGILNFVNSINDNAKIGFKKYLFTNRNTMWLPKVKGLGSDYDEAVFIADRIIELRDRGIALDQIAVIYRAGHHANFVEAELLKRSINYIKFGGIKFIEKKHIKDVLAFFRVSVNILDEVSWHRILKLLPQIGNIKATRIIQTINQCNGRLDIKDHKIGASSLLKELFVLLVEITNDSLPLSSKLLKIIDFYSPLLKAEVSDFNSRMLDIEVIKKLIQNYTDIEKFLSDFALDPPSNKFNNAIDPLIEEREEKSVILTTVHSSKGLEWYCVFVCHLLDGLFPGVKSIKNIEDIEEERRLFYVACSRAKEELYLTFPSYVSSYNGFFNLPLLDRLLKGLSTMNCRLKQRDQSTLLQRPSKKYTNINSRLKRQ
ncbi:ATP-dependent helicase [Ferrovum sp. PN-J185]|uniref:ATP-dependent helicase n=1 Tax=Ferrovum sp. PN-J185 TaxID=1356306 RepID=UPI000795BA51|nr:ATP-dependent helicase [Ferrovum sp. PN-J185]KXW55484.1 DNA helicase II [Ferrovum sp. PN-J185]